MTLAWVLAAALLLAPGRDHGVLGGAIARVVDAEPPLFKGDDERIKSAALVVAVTFRESSLRADALGDRVKGKPTSFCAGQINLPNGARTAEGWTGEELVADVDKCLRVTYRMLRESVRIDRRFPVAFYARGKNYLPCLVGTEGTPPPVCAEARRISNDRMAIAKRLVVEVTP